MRFVGAVDKSTAPEMLLRSAVRRGQAEAKARLMEFGASCEGCNVILPDPEMLHIHHVKPVHCGGTNAQSNTVLVCPNCHALAHYYDRTLAEADRPTDRSSLLARLNGRPPGAKVRSTSAWLKRTA